MAENRFYWLKLKEDYFSSPKIKKLRKIAGGDTFTIIYLKMQLLSVSSGGVITFERIEDNFEEELALKLDEQVEDFTGKVKLAFDAIEGRIDFENIKFGYTPEKNYEYDDDENNKLDIHGFRYSDRLFWP